MYRNSGIALDELGHDSAEGFDTEAQRGDIKKEHVLHVACEHTALDGGADGDYLVGIDALVGLLAEELFHEFLDLGDTGGSAYEQDFVDVGGAQVSILQGLAARLDAALEQIVAEGFELGAGKALHEVTGNAVNCGDVRQVDFGAGLVREFDLGLLGSLFETLESHRIFLEVDSAVFRCEFACEPVDDDLVEIVAAKMGVAVGGFHLEHAVTEFQDGDIEGAAAEVVHSDLHVLVLLVESVCKGCGGRLVDDTLDVEAGDLAGFLGCLPLGIREVCRNCDDSFGDRLTEIILGSLLHLLEDDCADLLGRVETPVDVDAGGVVVALYYAVRHTCGLTAYLVVGFAHETLDAEHRILRIGDGLTLCRVADFAFTVVGESHNRRGGALTFVIDDHGRLVAFHYGHATVRGSEVDSDNFSHNI